MTRQPRQRQGHLKATRWAMGVHREEFPALTQFVRGYLHEDYPEVHGSLPVAAAAFCADANADERRQVARELEALVRVSARWSLRDLRRFVTRDLASRWEPESRGELAELLDLIRTAT